MSIETDHTAPDRLITLSDGVFAIALTLLALDLRLPEAALRSGRIFEALGADWHKGLSFAISFWVIAVFWRANVRSFHWIERLDRTFVALSLLLLMAISFLPFPTAVLGQAGDSDEAILFYLASLAGASLIQLATWLYAARIGGLLRPDIPSAVVVDNIWRGVIPVMAFLASIAAVAAGAGTAAFFVLFAIPILPRLLRFAGAYG